MQAKSLVVSAALLAAACDKEPTKLDTIIEASAGSAKATASAAAPDPPRAPDIVVDNAYVAIGSDRVGVSEQGLVDKLGVFLNGRAMVENHSIDLVAMRNAKPSHVFATIAALRRAKVTGGGVKSDTRDGKTTRIALSYATSVPDCATVAWIGKDASINVWSAGGGAAKRQAKGLAGPDMTLGTELVRKQSVATCSASELVIGADDAMTWGLVYDLATMSLESPGARTNAILVVTSAVPGRKLSLE